MPIACHPHTARPRRRNLAPVSVGRWPCFRWIAGAPSTLQVEPVRLARHSGAQSHRLQLHSTRQLDDRDASDTRDGSRRPNIRCQIFRSSPAGMSLASGNSSGTLSCCRRRSGKLRAGAAAARSGCSPACGCSGALAPPAADAPYQGLYPYARKGGSPNQPMHPLEAPAETVGQVRTWPTRAADRLVRLH